MTAPAATPAPAGEADALAREARLIGFPELVRLLHGSAAARVGRTGPVGAERVLFRAAPSLGFPAGDIAQLFPVPRDDAGPEGAEPEGAEGTGWEHCLEVNFLGLYGPSSPLPIFWSEEVVTQGPGSASLRDFLDVFDHPLIALSYRVWRHYRLELDVAANASDRMSRAALALAGISPGPDNANEVLDLVRLLPLCGLLGQHARSAAVLEQVLGRYLGLPVAVEEWRARRVSVPEPERFRLNRPDALLGQGTVLGESVPDVGGGITLHVGPLERAALERFLPGEPGRAELRALVHLVLREPLECLVVLHLAPHPEPGGFTLGEASLGWFTWLAGAGGGSCPAGLL